MHGFGAVEVEPDEPVFHSDWERRALGVTMASFAIGRSNGGEFRHSIERMDPSHYLGSRYYESSMLNIFRRLDADNFQTVLIERKEDIWPSFKAFLAKDRGREQG